MVSTIKSSKSEKPKKARILRILKKKEAQLVENTKNTLIFKGHATSQSVIDILHDISSLKKPNCRLLARKNEILPFEDANSLEFLTTKNDCSLFLMASHTKKRPDNLTFGRTFDGHILDVIEFGACNHVPLVSFEGMKKAMGSKPLLSFQGSQWESDTVYKKMQNFLIDFFRGDSPDKIALKGIDHVLSLSIIDGVINFRAYSVSFRKSGTKVPNVSLLPMGPSFDLVLRRHTFASDDLWKTACKKPKQLKTFKKKNIKRTELGETIGRIHIERQDLSKTIGKMMPVLRDRRSKKKETK